MDRNNGGQNQLCVPKNKLNLKLDIKNDVKKGKVFSPIPEDAPVRTKGCLSTPSTADFLTAQSFVTSSPVFGDANNEMVRKIPAAVGIQVRRSSAGNTPGTDFGEAVAILAPPHRVRWNAKEIKKKIKHKDNRVSDRPGTPFPGQRSKTKETSASTDNADNVDSREMEEIPLDSPKLLSDQSIENSGLPIISVIPPTPTTFTTQDGSSINITASQLCTPAEPSPVVSDFSGAVSNSDTEPSPWLARLPRTNPQGSSLALPSHRTPANPSYMDSNTPSTVNNAELTISTGGGVMVNSDRDSGLCLVEEVSYVSGSYLQRPGPIQLRRLSSSSYVRTPRRILDSVLVSDESGIGSAASSSHYVPRSGDRSEVETKSTCFMKFKTFALALATLGTALCLSLLGPNLPAILEQAGLTVESASMLVTTRSAGGLIGVFILYRCFDDVTPIMSSALALISSGVLSIILPYLKGETPLNIVLFFSGIALAFFYCASGAVSLHIWSSKHLTHTILSQLCLCCGLILGPTISLLPIMYLDNELSTTNQTTLKDTMEITNGILNNSPPEYLPRLPKFSTTPSGSLESQLPSIDYTYIYIAAGTITCIAGFLFFIIWINSDEPTFYNRFSTFDFLKGDMNISEIGAKHIDRHQKVRYCLFIMLSVSMVTIQMGMEGTFQNLYVLYVSKDVPYYPRNLMLYLLMAHYATYLGGRVIGAAIGIIIGLVPLLIFCAIATISGFLVQFLLIGKNDMATWMSVTLSGFSMGAFLPTLVRLMEAKVGVSRQVAGSMLAGAYISMSVLPGVTGHLMLTYGPKSFHITLLTTSSLIFCLLVPFLFMESHLSDAIKEREIKSKYGDVHVDPNQNIMDGDEQHGEEKQQGRKSIQIVDDNGNVMVMRDLTTTDDTGRIRGEPYSMTGLVSLGSRAVAGRW